MADNQDYDLFIRTSLMPSGSNSGPDNRISAPMTLQKPRVLRLVCQPSCYLVDNIGPVHSVTGKESYLVHPHGCNPKVIAKSQLQHVDDEGCGGSGDEVEFFRKAFRGGKCKAQHNPRDGEAPVRGLRGTN